MVRIDVRGSMTTLLEDERIIPNPIAIAADPSSGDILVADNHTDILLLLPAGQVANARKIVQIKGHEGHLQSMSVAFGQNGHFLFGGSGPDGIYRFRAQEAVDMGQPLLLNDGAVLADPSSKQWVVALRSEMRIFEGTRELLRIPCPSGKQKWHNAVAFGPDGTLVVALCSGQTAYEVFLVDQEARAFHSLFPWNESRVVSLAVGRKAAWTK